MYVQQKQWRFGPKWLYYVNSYSCIQSGYHNSLISKYDESKGGNTIYKCCHCQNSVSSSGMRYARLVCVLVPRLIEAIAKMLEESSHEQDNQ